MTTTAQQLLSTIADHLRGADAFDAVELDGDSLRCRARDAAEEAWYRLEPETEAPGGWAISLVTADRWLSESIEADLVHTGDPIEELVEEELVELGVDQPRVTVQHYRSDDMLYTFRTPLPAMQDDVARAVATWLLGYEAAFRELGDMSGGEAD